MVPDVQVHAAGQRGGGAPPHQRRIQVLYCDCTVHCTVLYCTIYRITPTEVNSRQSSCLTNFLLSGESLSMCHFNMRFMYKLKHVFCMHKNDNIVKLRQGSGKEGQGMALKAKGLKS